MNAWPSELERDLERVSQELHRRFDADIAQTALEHVLRFVATGGTVTNWLYYALRAARNCQMDEWRARKRRASIQFLPASQETPSGAAEVEARIALSKVPKTIRRIFGTPRSQRTPAEHSRLCRFQKQSRTISTPANVLMRGK